MIAVSGDAGHGKSYLAAQLTAPTAERPAGLFFLGSDLARDGTLDDFSARAPGIATSTFEELLAALDAAGGRAGRRLPLVIDGLNEAQDPRIWKRLLARLIPILDRYPCVLLVVTLRSAAMADALPDGAERLPLVGFRHNLHGAVERYFKHYLIDPGEARLPWARFSDPLFLRMFCESTNPNRKQTVGVEALPTSLTAVFERYRDTATERIRERLAVPLPPGYVAKALDKVAVALWDRRARTLPSEEVAGLIGDDPRDWQHSLARALEEGILWRDPGRNWSDPRSGVLFDAFSGFLIADVLVRATGSQGAQTAEWWTALAPNADGEHPLAADVLRSLVALLPRRVRKQVWKLAPSDIRDWSLVEAAQLEAEWLDAETVDALAVLVSEQSHATRALCRVLFDRLMEVRDAPVHPFER